MLCRKYKGDNGKEHGNYLIMTLTSLTLHSYQDIKMLRFGGIVLLRCQDLKARETWGLNLLRFLAVLVVACRASWQGLKVWQLKVEGLVGRHLVLERCQAFRGSSFRVVDVFGVRLVC